MTDVAPERDVDLVVAHLHLRLGSLQLARAELEEMAGKGTLDDEGLIDLAEARWRTGDLTGAGEAANVALSAGPNAIENIAMTNTNTYSKGRLSSPMACRMGMEASSPVLTRSITIMARRLSSRSSRTPARGPKTSGGMVCKTPISDIFSAESVIA